MPDSSTGREARSITPASHEAIEDGPRPVGTHHPAMPPTPSPTQPDAAPAAGADVEALKPALLARFGPDFVGLVDNMALHNAAHLRELLDAPTDEQDQLVMAWMKAAVALEAEWSAQSRRLASGQQLSLARHMEIRLPSPRAALAVQQAPQPPAKTAEQEPPTPRERMSAQRRIRLELAIAEARAALRRVDALDQLVEVDRQAIVGELEEMMSEISRRLRPGG